jgi:hypothetical protein
MIDSIIKLLLLDSNQIEPGENFYPIDNYDNKYFISPLGKVYSAISKKILKARINKPNPYLYVSLGSYSAKRTISIHRLVALHFIPNIENKREVHHIDGNILNNHYTNLMFVTGEENIQFAKDMGKYRNNPQKKPRED